MTSIQKKILLFFPLFFTMIFFSFLFYQGYQHQLHYHFKLNTDQGKIDSYDFRGKKTLVYFGYGLCPDICPTTLIALSETLHQLSPQERQNIEVVFISVDPERDTPQKMGTFARYFHPSIRAGTTSIQETTLLVHNYGASFKKVPLPQSSLGYSIAHSADIYILNSYGILEATLPFGVEPHDIVKALRYHESFLSLIQRILF